MVILVTDANLSPIFESPPNKVPGAKRSKESRSSIPTSMGKTTGEAADDEDDRSEVGLGTSVDTLRYLSAKLLTIQEDEQRRIAMELHDGCVQDLSVLKLRLKGLQRGLPAGDSELRTQCNQLLTFADKIINDIRSLAHGLNLAELDVLGLSAAVRQALSEFSNGAGIQVEIDVVRLDGIRSPNAKVCLFRILQEALTNIIKHAQATRVSVFADEDDPYLRIRISDNGVGFDPEIYRNGNHTRRGMGLSAMALRCRMIGATLSIDSETGKGTRLIVRMPHCRTSG